ncbi:MAG: acyl-CoA dehydratase activase-related protein, partial [Phycisphaerae bacterium]
QCSAGNGYFLQSTADGFGHTVEEYADIAFSAKAMPSFGYGCAVFMQSDIVDFQRQGWAPEEIMAGLCDVLPKNIWLYVSQIPNLAKLGTKFLLQGGTQHNLAAVKAQVDFIKSRFRGTGIEPEVIVHKFCGEAGAIGCAVEAHRLYTENGHRSSFIGLDRVKKIKYRTTRDENTRCYFCKNKCLRTFIDVKTTDEAAQAPARAAAPSHAHEGRMGEEVGVRVDLSTHMYKTGPEVPHPARIKQGSGEAPGANGGRRSDEPRQPVRAVEPETSGAEAVGTGRKKKSKVPLELGEQRLIIATCEKGTVEDVNDMRQIKKGLDEVKKANPNFAEIFATQTFRPTGVGCVADPEPRRGLGRFLKRKRIDERIALMRRRKSVRIGLPRVLNMYSMAPWFTAYFESLGVAKANLVWSDYTSEENFKEGAKRGAIDPCFPSKVGIPHVHNLLYHKHSERKPLDYIFFPMIDCLPSFLEGILDSRACPTVTTTPEAVKAAFTKEGDLFAEFGIQYLDTFLNFSEPPLLARQMYDEFKDKLGLSEEENRRACRAAWARHDAFFAARRREARELLDRLEANDEIGVVLLSRPYHSDPGICHEIPHEFQKIGIPVFTIDSLPHDPDLLDRLFGDEVRAGAFTGPLSIEDAWKNAYSENTNRKVWAAKFAARHPNLVALELSSFKCGHDAPIYSVIEEIIERSGTPYFCFKDIDENKPTGSIRIRIETIAYFLNRHREKLTARRRKMADIEAKLAELEARLRAGQSAVSVETAPVVGV